MADDLFRLLQVREKNNEMAKDWLLFISTSRFNRLRPGEVYLAFKMAMSRELLDEKGNGINILPELSNNTTGIVLSAYLRWKRSNNKYQLAKEGLKSLPERNVSENEKKETHEIFLKMVYDELVMERYSDSAWLLYDEIKPKLSIRKEVLIRLFRIQTVKLQKKKNTNRFNVSSVVGSVENTCRSIVACNYLKKYLIDFETFKKAIK